MPCQPDPSPSPMPSSTIHNVAADSALCVQRVVSSADLAVLADDWNALADDIPFRRWEWLEAWWRHCRPADAELFVLLVRENDGKLVGVAPWCIRRFALYGGVISFLGSGMACSDYMGLLVPSGREDEIARRVAQWLSSETADWHALELGGVDWNDSSVRRLVEALALSGHAVHEAPAPSCWRVSLADGWEPYLASLGKNRRGRVRQLRRRQFDTGRAVVRSAERLEDLPRGMAILRDLHQRRRTSLGERGCFADPTFESFLTEAAERFLLLGRLRLQWIELEGRPVAVEFELTGGDTVYYYQSGIDPAITEERPGWLGTIAALEWTIAHGYKAFDFLRGDEAYKAHWRAEPRAMVDIRVVARRPAATVRHGVWLGRKRARQWIKRGLEIAGLRKRVDESITPGRAASTMEAPQ